MMTLPISKRQIKKAIQECLKQVEKAPRDKRLRLKLGDLYLKNGEKEKAVDEYLRAGDLHAEQDLNARAIAIYKKVVSIDPEHIEALHKMATLYLKEELLGDAGVCYEKILKIKPRDQEAIKALSVIEHSKQLKREELDSSTIGFPVLSDPLEEDLPLHLCMCPYCLRSHWIIPRSDYYFRCSCGGVSIFDGLTMREVTPAEYKEIKSVDQMKTLGNA
jgi:tetratricopeptide (TPR) repeat protein